MSEGVKVKEFYFVDENPQETSLDEYQVMFGPSTDGEGFELYQCTEAGYFDEDAILVVLERGDAISVADGSLHQAIRCTLMSESWLEESDYEKSQVEVMDIPERFVGVDLPEVDKLNENQMAPFNLSINAGKARRGEIEGQESIWRKFGKKVGQIFNRSG